jgi:hypothetical protein
MTEAERGLAALKLARRGMAPAKIAALLALADSSAAQNAIIRAAYDGPEDVPLSELMALTGLGRSAVKMRAKRMNLSSRDRQKRMSAAHNRARKTAEGEA